MGDFNKKLQEKLKNYFEVSDFTSEQTLNILTLYIYSLDAHLHDLHLLAEILDNESLSKIISYFDGAIIKLPTKEQYRESKLLSACFYLKEIKGWNWGKIKEYLQLTDDNADYFSTISIGKRINRLKEEMKPKILELLLDKDIYDINTVIKRYINE